MARWRVTGLISEVSKEKPKDQYGTMMRYNFVITVSAEKFHEALKEAETRMAFRVEKQGDVAHVFIKATLAELLPGPGESQ